MIITRRTHPLVKELRDLRDHSNPALLFLEGPKLVQEALQGKISLKSLILSDSFKGHDSLAGRAKSQSQSHFTVSDAIFRSISDVEEPQGILAIGQRPVWSWDKLTARAPAPIIILEGLQNPGNVASVVRTAEAAGAAGVVTTPGTARLTSPKALRGAMGSSLRLPSMEQIPVEEITDRLARGGYRIYGTSAERGMRNAEEGIQNKENHIPNSAFRAPHLVLYTEVDWTHASAIAFGQEGGGLSKAWAPFLHQTVIIPMRPPVESLNVAAAAAVLLYEVVRQRQTEINRDL